MYFMQVISALTYQTRSFHLILKSHSMDPDHSDNFLSLRHNIRKELFI